MLALKNAYFVAFKLLECPSHARHDIFKCIATNLNPAIYVCIPQRESHVECYAHLLPRLDFEIICVGQISCSHLNFDVRYVPEELKSLSPEKVQVG